MEDLGKRRKGLGVRRDEVYSAVHVQEFTGGVAPDAMDPVKLEGHHFADQEVVPTGADPCAVASNQCLTAIAAAQGLEVVTTIAEPRTSPTNKNATWASVPAKTNVNISLDIHKSGDSYHAPIEKEGTRGATPMKAIGCITHVQNLKGLELSSGHHVSTGAEPCAFSSDNQATWTSVPTKGIVDFNSDTHKLMVDGQRSAVEKKKLSKSSKIALDSQDRKVLLDYVNEVGASMGKGMSFGTIPLLPLPCFQINICRNVPVEYLSNRAQIVKPGIDLIMRKGSFAVPSSYKSGNVYVDRINLELFKLYMGVNKMLEGAQNMSELAVKGLKSRDSKDDYQAAVSTLRSAARKVRGIITDLDGLPLQEPNRYWLLAFPDAMS